ncbi:DNA polymerase III subunit beta [Formicincola oecophyllae]|uniref:Beta sliding clamp n=1 Tax=Formicincola oecophyllae TaxID=2558361 RepID=A0A4Y6U6S3_9PROT|nr:DNA polymerase III subunit beta [Formicincola oecophyllae]QDH12854.1 DNA polymerase III subunit beta [Formicincola oecophyllae]
MKFKVDRPSLQRALAHVHSVAEKRNTVPILANVLLNAEGGALALTATDMEIALVESLPSVTAEPGATTVPAAVLFEIVRKLSDPEIEFSQQGEGAPLHVRAGRFETDLMTLPAAEFPAMTTGTLPFTFTVPPAHLRNLIERTRFAMSNEETRYYLNGIYFHAHHPEGGALGDSRLRAVATDGHRLAQVDAPLPEGAGGMPGVIVPRKTVLELLKLLDGGEQDIEVALSDTRIQFQVGPITLTSKLVDGVFPDYERVIPRHNERLLRLDRRAFAEAIARVAAISQERHRPIKLHIAPNQLKLEARSADQGTAQEELDENYVTYSDEPMEIGFQARYLTDITDQLDGEGEFRFADGAAPALVSDPANPDVLFVLMPIRV